MGLIIGFLAIADFLQSYFIIPIIMFVFVIVVMAFFRKQYWLPVKNIFHYFNTIIEKITALNVDSKTTKTLLNDIFSHNQTLKHAWENYKNSLHDIREDIDGKLRTIASRSTVSSEIFFSQITIIDTPLKFDFYKHVPGIVTGMGIIATFFGLLAFDPAGEPEKVQNYLLISQA